MKAMGEEAKTPKILNEIAPLIQHDWFESARDPHSEGKFFVGIRRPGEKSKFTDVVQSKDGTFSTMAPEEVSVERMEGRLLHVQFFESLDTTFVAPSVEFSTVHSSSVLSVDASQTGRLIVSSDANGELVVWDSKSGDIIRKFEGHALDVNKAKFFPSGLVVLSAGMDMTLRIWSVETGQCARVLTGHTQAVLDIGIVGRGRDVLSCSKDGTVKMWNCGGGNCVKTWYPGGGHVTALSVLSYSDDSDSAEFVVATEKGRIAVFDSRTNEAAVKFYLPSHECTAVTYGSDDSQFIYVGNAEGSILMLDKRMRSALVQLKTSRGSVKKLFNQKTLGLISAYNDGTVSTYDLPLAVNTSTYEFSGADFDPIYDFSLSCDNCLYTACRDRIVRKYSLPRPSEIS